MYGRMVMIGNLFSLILCGIKMVSEFVRMDFGSWTSNILAPLFSFVSRYSVDKIPVYDSAEDELTSEPSKNVESNTNEEKDISTENHAESTALIVQQSDPNPMEEDIVTETVKTEAAEDMKLLSQDSQQDLSQKTAIISRVRGNSYKIKSEPLPKKRGRPLSSGKTKNVAQKHVDISNVVQRLASKEAQDEILKYEVKSFSAHNV